MRERSNGRRAVVALGEQQREIRRLYDVLCQRGANSNIAGSTVIGQANTIAGNPIEPRGINIDQRHLRPASAMRAANRQPIAPAPMIATVWEIGSSRLRQML
jgi:hypothetical protein